MTENNDQIKNIALVAHSGSGKTSISETMLYQAKITKRMGRIEDGNSIMDFEPEEIKRQSSISSSFYQIPWKEKTISIIDTPGDQNFISDTKLCMQAAESSIIVIDGVDGIKIQTEKTFEFSNSFNQPCVFFINKLDKDRSNYEYILEDIKKNLNINPTLIHFPLLENNTINGIVDLITKKVHDYKNNKVYDISKLSSEIINKIEKKRINLVENIAERDDNLIEKYLNGEEISNENLINSLKKSILTRSIFPILLGSAIKNIGTNLLMDFIILVLPSMIDFKEKKGVDPIKKKEIVRKISNVEPLSAFVFKTITDPYAGKLSLLKIVSGFLKDDGTLYNSNKDSKERYSQLLEIAGKNQKPIEFAGPGAIVAIRKLKDTKTGDTICENSHKILYECAKPLLTLISFSIEAKNKGEEDKVYSSLYKILEDDPSLKLERNSETKETLISGLGQVHVKVTVEKLKRKYNVEAILEIPKVPYKETIKKKVRVQGKHKKQSGGHGQFGDCWITMEPLPRGSGFKFVDAIVGGAIPRQYIPAVEKGIIESSQNGILTGYQCIDFKAICDFGSYHPVDSSEMAFKIAASLAFKKACKEAKTVILEPIMKIDITIPDEFTGDIMGDLNSKRGRVLGVDTAGKNQVIHAEAPLSEIQTYDQDLKSLTAGRGIFFMKFCKYDEVPNNLFDKVIEKIKQYNSKK